MRPKCESQPQPQPRPQPQPTLHVMSSPPCACPTPKVKRAGGAGWAWNPSTQTETNCDAQLTRKCCHPSWGRGRGTKSAKERRGGRYWALCKDLRWRPLHLVGGWVAGRPGGWDAQLALTIIVQFEEQVQWAVEHRYKLTFIWASSFTALLSFSSTWWASCWSSPLRDSKRDSFELDHFDKLMNFDELVLRLF